MYMKNIWSGESWLLSDTSAPSLYSESKTFLFLKSIVWKMNVSTICYFLLFDVFSSPDAHLLHNIILITCFYLSLFQSVKAYM